jgi:ADP-heptose:LPS heptosyltransferase
MGGIGDMLLLEHGVNLYAEFELTEMDLAYVPSRLKGIPELNPRVRKVHYVKNDVRSFFDLQQSTSARNSFWRLIWHRSRDLFSLASHRYEKTITYGLSPNIRAFGEGFNALIQAGETVLVGEDVHGCFDAVIPADPRKNSRWDIFGCPFGKREEAGWEYRFGSNPKLDTRYVVIGPGGEDLIVPRKWGAERFQDLSKRILKETNWKIVLLGGKGDQSVCAEIQELAPDRVIDKSGQLNILQSMTYMEHAHAIVCNDSGIQHMSWRSGQLNTLVIYGPTDPKLLVPDGLGIQAFQSKRACVPCAGGIIDPETAACDQEISGICLQEVSVEEVWDQLKSVES